MADPERRRRRLRQGSVAGRSAAAGAEAQNESGAATGAGRGDGTPAGAEDREAERGLRGLVGSGASQVGISGALRARDAARPTDADLAEAEERLVIVRRNWVPREDLPRGGL